MLVGNVFNAMLSPFPHCLKAIALMWCTWSSIKSRHGNWFYRGRLDFPCPLCPFLIDQGAELFNHATKPVRHKAHWHADYRDMLHSLSLFIWLKLITLLFCTNHSRQMIQIHLDRSTFTRDNREPEPICRMKGFKDAICICCHHNSTIKRRHHPVAMRTDACRKYLLADITFPKSYIHPKDLYEYQLAPWYLLKRDSTGPIKIIRGQAWTLSSLFSAK